MNIFLMSDIIAINFQDFPGHKDFNPEILRYLLAEIHAHNPLYPVRRVYKQLSKKFREASGKIVPAECGEKGILFIAHLLKFKLI